MGRCHAARIAALAAAALLLSAAAAFAASPLGVWATEGGEAQVEITDCGNRLCGTIIALLEPLDDKGQEKTDINNPDPAARGRKIIGLPLLGNFIKSSSGDNQWEDGRIYNPENGKTYRCTMTLQDDNTLRIRGYVGVPLFGETQVWTRVR